MWKGYCRHNLHHSITDFCNAWTMGYEEEGGESMSAMGLEKPREPVLGYGTQRRTAEGPSELHKPHSKRSKRVREMTEKRGGNS